MRKERVHFYSSYDLSISMQYDRMEEVVRGYEEGNSPQDINDYLEMYHILQFVENDVCPSAWTEERKSGIRRYKVEVIKYLSKLSAKELVDQYPSIGYEYQNTIWDIVDSCKLKNLIDGDAWKKLTDEEPYYLRDLLEHKWIVEHNGLIITKLLKENPHTAEWLLEQYVLDDGFDEHSQMFFPKSLTGKDKDDIIRQYVNSPNANLNYVRMVLYAKRSEDFPLHPLTVKAARIKEQILGQEVLEHGIVHKFGISVAMTMEEDSPIKDYKEGKDGCDTFVYNRHLIDAIKDYGIVFYCARVFELMTRDGFIYGISKMSDMSAMERAFLSMRAKNTYLKSATFRLAENLAHLQMQALGSVLHDKGRCIERVIKTFYEDYLDEEYGYEGLPLTLPYDKKEMIEKVRSMAIEMDAVVHQFSCYVVSGMIDKDLIELTPPQKLTDTKSLISRRYCVLNKDDKDVIRLIRLFFGDQSMLFYVEPCKDMRLRNYYALLTKGIEVKYDSYAVYQKPDIDYLIDKGYLSKGDDGILRCEKMQEIKILKHLYEYGACGYWVYSPQERAILNEMEKKGWITFDNHLFTPAERDYYSYYLNNEKYTNGPAIRNNYIHGTTPSYSAERHEVNYYRLQVLFIMLLLKISEDLDMKRFLGENGIKNG